MWRSLRPMTFHPPMELIGEDVELELVRYIGRRGDGEPGSFSDGLRTVQSIVERPPLRAMRPAFSTRRRVSGGRCSAGACHTLQRFRPSALDA